MYDLLILHGKIISGLGNPWFWGDVAVVGQKIVKIGRLDKEAAAKVIDAQGCFVTPGFIDGHSHSDLALLVDPGAEQKVMQGVTTENVGLDGMSVAPMVERYIKDWRRHLSGLAGDPPIEWHWRSFSDYLDAIDALPPSLNITSYVGLGPIRLGVMGMTDREAIEDEIRQMGQIAAAAMEEGARGVSAGLIYPPGQYQSLAEILEIARVVQERDGIFDVHMRGESKGIIEAIEEVLEVGRQTGIHVLITHFKVRGKENWHLLDKAFKLLDKARQEGIDVTLAQYPYTAGSTMLQAVIPPWYHAGGPDELIRLIREERESIKRDIRKRVDWENIAATIGWENIVVSSVESAANKQYGGKNMVEIASMRSLTDPTDAALDLLAEEELAVGMIGFGFSEENVMAIMKHPTVSFITDGLLGGEHPHPRVYGTYPRILGRYVREKGILSFEEAIRKMTSLPAEKLKLRSKGVIGENFDADITIFDPATIIDQATYENPKQFSSGIICVIVNGKVVVENGAHTRATPGRTIRGR